MYSILFKKEEAIRQRGGRKRDWEHVHPFSLFLIMALLYADLPTRWDFLQSENKYSWRFYSHLCAADVYMCRVAKKLELPDTYFSSQGQTWWHCAFLFHFSCCKQISFSWFMPCLSYLCFFGDLVFKIAPTYSAKCYLVFSSPRRP